MTKKSRQKLKNLENEKSFWREINIIFHFLKGLSAAKNCLRPESAPLILAKKNKNKLKPKTESLSHKLYEQSAQNKVLVAYDFHITLKIWKRSS